MSAHTHRYVPSPGDSITHVACELCGLRITHELMLRCVLAGEVGIANAPSLWWDLFGAVLVSIARREVFRTTGVKVRS